MKLNICIFVERPQHIIRLFSMNMNQFVPITKKKSEWTYTLLMLISCNLAFLIMRRFFNPRFTHLPSFIHIRIHLIKKRLTFCNNFFFDL